MHTSSTVCNDHAPTIAGCYQKPGGVYSDLHMYTSLLVFGSLCDLSAFCVFCHQKQESWVRFPTVCSAPAHVTTSVSSLLREAESIQAPFAAAPFLLPPTPHQYQHTLWTRRLMFHKPLPLSAKRRFPPAYFLELRGISPTVN
jgi:hypothetical protein